MTELGQRFDFLLRPIKDLTKNWNVDIAAVLEDFHEEVTNYVRSYRKVCVNEYILYFDSC